MPHEHTPKYISHIRKSSDGKIIFQSNEEHCSEVAKRAKYFAKDFGMEEWGFVLGILHDKGKEKKAFQEYIRDVNDIAYEKYNYKEKEHAYVGAIIAQRTYGTGALHIFCNPIASHHRGLYDYDELENILKLPLPEEVNAFHEKVHLNVAPFKLYQQDFHHLTRMLFSCLVDADYLDTEFFMNKEKADMRGSKVHPEMLLKQLQEHIETLQKEAIPSEVNNIRKIVHEHCKSMAYSPKGFYNLTVPTGGGKTLSSLVWALTHAVHNGMRRVIIAIPYTSIIVQTARVLKSIFGEGNVLEHHSNYNVHSITDATQRHKEKLASENWDYPIIVTTNVQLFESMFSNKPSECRKLHNIANSVIILDEVQTLPTDFLRPIVDTLNSYQHMFGISVLFSTASQPLLCDTIEGCNPRASFQALKNVKEIVPPNMELHKKLRRTKIEFNETGKTYDEIANELVKHKRVLCIVNTRRDATEIYDRLPKEGITLHLSKMMCPKHVASTIEILRNSLANNQTDIIRVVSTQLIEAGVDIDFPSVYRQEAGLDSILQAAGRCNREGRLKTATTHVFSLSKEHPIHGYIKDANEARKSMAYCNDWFAPETMREFFKQFYSRKETFDKKDIASSLYNTKELCFEKAAKDFHLIEDKGIHVIVNFSDSMEMVERLKREGISYNLMKELGQYTVTVFKQDFERLVHCGLVEEVLEGIYVITDQFQYDEHFGLRLDKHWMEEILMV